MMGKRQGNPEMDGAKIKKSKGDESIGAPQRSESRSERGQEDVLNRSQSYRAPSRKNTQFCEHFETIRDNNNEIRRRRQTIPRVAFISSPISPVDLEIGNC